MNNFVEKIIVVDLKAPVTNKVHSLKRFDTNIIKFIIKNNGKDADLSNVSIMILHFKRQDNKVFSHHLTPENNVIKFQLNNFHTELIGKCEMVLQFYDGDNNISSSKITIYISESIETDEIPIEEVILIHPLADKVHKKRKELDEHNDDSLLLQKQLNTKTVKAYHTPDEFNAYKDGNTDNSTVFSNMLKAGTKFFLVTTGTYLFNNPFFIRNNSITMLGENRRDTILKNGTGQETYAATVDFTNSSNSIISNITLDGNIDNVTGDIWKGVVNMRIERGKNIIVRDVTFQNNNHVAIFVKDCKNVVIDNCDFDNVDSGINGVNSRTLEDIFITRCRFNGHIESEPISIPNSKRITITDCVMLNKQRGHAVAFEGSTDIYINNIYAENCGNAIWTVMLNGQRPQRIKVENSYFKNMTSGSRLENTDDVEFTNCTFEDGFFHIVDCTKVTFKNCKFISKNKPSMVAFSEMPSSNIKFVDCVIDNTSSKNWGSAFVTLYDTKTKVTNLAFERCNFINAILRNGEFSVDSTVKMIDCIRNGDLYYVNKTGVENRNNSAFKSVATSIPTSGFHKKNAMVLFGKPTAHIGAINMVAGYGFAGNWVANGMTVWEGLQVKMSNGIVIRAKNSGTIAAGTKEPTLITAANTETNPFVDTNGIQWIYLGVGANFKNFGAIIE